MDTDVYELNNFSGEYIKIWTFPLKCQFASAVGLTRSKILFSLPYYAKIVMYKWNDIEKFYVEVAKAKMCKHTEVYLTQMKLNLYSSKEQKEIFALFSQENLYKFTLNETDLQQTRRRPVFRMSRQRCIDYKVVDPEHILLMYTYQLVLVNLKMSEDHDQLWGSGPVIPLTVIKFDTE